MAVDPAIKKIKITGHRSTRIITCPYCRKPQSVTLVNHLRREHPEKWDEWTSEFVRIYNETNDLKRVMRAFANAQGQLVLSWTVIDRELKRKIEGDGHAAVFIRKQLISNWQPPQSEYTRFATTLWDVPRRGTWAVHQSTYRGNWAPQIPRALLEMYSNPGDLVLDPFVGGGTTLIECYLMGRRAIGSDISAFALELCRSRLDELRSRATRETLFGYPEVDITVRRADARKLPGVKRDSIDFICTHPPYGDALRYSHSDPADLSHVTDPVTFMAELQKAANRFFQVLKPGKYCAMLIGDLRRDGELFTFGFEAVAMFRAIGFSIEDVIIKAQHQDRSTEFFYRNAPMRLRLAHEYLLVARKPDNAHATETGV